MSNVNNIISLVTRQKMMTRSIFFRLSVILLLASLFSCLDQINLEIPKNLETSIVIQGELIKGNPSTVSVTVTRLFDFSANSVQPVNVRSVILRDENGNELDIPSPDLGFHEAIIPANLFSMEDGASFQLEVNTFDSRTFRSSFEPILAVPKADSISARVIQKDVIDGQGEFRPADFMQFFVTTPLKSSDATDAPYFRWNIERTYRLTDGSAFSLNEPKLCYITEGTKADNIVLLNPNTLTADKVTDFRVFDERINYLFAEGYYITVYQQAISAGAHDYWDQIRNIIERGGNMFEPPAGKILSNFENIADPLDEAFGYFSVIQQDTVRLYISPERAGSPSMSCPPAKEQPKPDGSCPIAICCDCLSGTNSTLRKPDFWVE